MAAARQASARRGTAGHAWRGARPLGHTATREVRLRRAGLLLRCGCTQDEAGTEHDEDRHIGQINDAVDAWIREGAR
jgi:hypothetical protein